MTKKAVLNRFCATIAVLALITIFFPRMSGLYAEKFNQSKATIESYFGKPAKEDLLKRLYRSYLYATGRSYINGIYILNDGRLHLNLESPSGPTLLSERANVIIELNNYLSEKNTPFLFIRCPNKLKDNSEIPRGYKSTGFQDSARFMAMLNAGGVDTLDLREEMINEGFDFTEMFYWGDHHWTAPAALWGFGKAGTLMNEIYGFNLDDRTWNPLEYEQITLNKTFVGTESLRVSNVSEDITVLVPKFKTEFEILPLPENPDDEAEILASGDFAEVFTPKLLGNNSDFTYVHLNAVRNNKRYRNIGSAPNTNKVLLIGDSFAVPFVTYLANAVEFVDYLYLDNAGNQKFYPLLENEHYDLVIFLLYDGTLVSDGTNIEKDRMYLGESPAKR